MNRVFVRRSFKCLEISSHIGRKCFHTRSNGTEKREEGQKLEAAIKYCSDLVRKHDPENYLVSMFYPKHLQKVYYTIRAFNLELVMVRDSVSNPQIGKIRMQFWRDTIDNVFKGKPPQQPIAQALFNALETCRLSPLFFKRVIDEREANLDDLPYFSIKDLESYGENTASCLLYLHLESLNVKDMQADHAASHIGKAIGIVTILRAFPYLASKRRMLLPTELIAKHNISQEEIFRSGPVKGLDDVVFEIATLAHDHLLTARSFLPYIPGQALPALLSAVPCDLYLKRLEKYNFNVFEPKVNRKDWRLPIQLWLRYRKEEF
ncbi:4292_t:CDS:2 [Dentiscutata heterogama]|uniref:4292_t:CDS:1 n=1 Tax=Dentiscutata heterogama TaxID=1316150 RepID=A0ACA9JYX4_9GLOM|nr:4292_t:CDS:2 [Dentiscutata heterogama]